MSPLWLVGCLRLTPPTPSERQPLAAQVSLSVDRTLGRADLRIHTFQAQLQPLPAERQGIPMDACGTVEPVTATEGLVLRRAEVRASCEGQALTLDEQAPGLVEARFALPPPAGFRCAVEVDGLAIELPPVPETPDLTLGPLRARWTPAGADEVRVVTPRSEGRSTICRLSDTGSGPIPRQAWRTLSFLSRHRFLLTEPTSAGGRVAVTVTVGVWSP